MQSLHFHTRKEISLRSEFPKKQIKVFCMNVMEINCNELIFSVT